jgi:hypothetical protein
MDAVLFASFALLMTVIFSTGLSALYVLLAGAACEALSFAFNLGHMSNAIALWLGMKVCCFRRFCELSQREMWMG